MSNSSLCFSLRFAEIAFCAISANQQVRGFGSTLMNLCKMQGAKEGIEYFITYADNYAVGYFKKVRLCVCGSGGGWGEARSKARSEVVIYVQVHIPTFRLAH